MLRDYRSVPSEVDFTEPTWSGESPGVADVIAGVCSGQASNMNDSLKQRVRAKLVRQLAEDGKPDTEHDDPRQLSVETDLEALDSVADEDPLIEELAARYLVF